MPTFRCHACGGLNQFHRKLLIDKPACERCTAVLDLANRPRYIGDEELRQLIVTAGVPLVVEFWAKWCAPCRIAAPHLDALARRHAGEVLVLRIDMEKQRGIADELQIRTIPTLVLYRRGKLAARHAGALLGPQLEGFVAPHLAHVWAIT